MIRLAVRNQGTDANDRVIEMFGNADHLADFRVGLADKIIGG